MKKPFLRSSLQLSSLVFILSLLAIPVSAQWKVPADAMITPFGKKVTPENAWQEYPRPQLERSDWINLNGLWDYSLLKVSEKHPSKYQGKILVPFAVESALSGVRKSVKDDDRIWYRRTFSVPSDWKGKNVILNFEAVDWSATVWVNGALVGAHKGAFDRFSFDITPYLTSSGKQEIIVSVTDPTSLGTQARGKQQMPQEGIWYTPVSGIWQTVWLEAVSPTTWIKEVKLTPDIDQKTISVIPLLNYPPAKELYTVEVEVFDGNTSLGTSEVAADNELVINIDNPKLWSPESPFLYDLKLTLKDQDNKILDEVNSYFGMRKISLGDHQGVKYLFLNNKPLFHYGPLDQGWWPDGLHTPPSDEGMRWDIEKTKALGFNAIRKHIKVEPDRWYYHCDQLGIMVWQDMPSGMVVLPPQGEERPNRIQHVSRTGQDLFRRTEETAQFEYELRRMIDLHHNAPSIVMWVPFNEGWGQYETCRISDWVKAYDPTRLVNAVSGWALRPCGDIYDIHSYHVEVHTPPTSLSQASVLGEYGGIGYPIKGHQWNPDMRNWGYQTYHSGEELLKSYTYKFDQIVEMKKSKGLSAAIYTQTTDVEGEVNGLITYDREVIKFPEEQLKEMHSVLYED